MQITIREPGSAITHYIGMMMALVAAVPLMIVTPQRAVELKTAELRQVLGDISLAEPEVQMWIKGYLDEQYGLTEQND